LDQAEVGKKVTDGIIGTADNANDAASLGALVAGGDAPAGHRVEKVYPDYERPPGTPEELAQMRSEIAALMVCRDQADADADAARADQAETARQADQLQTVASGVDDLGRRTDQQRTDVASTAEANVEQTGRQEDAGTSILDSASRLTGLVTLELLLGAWAAVTVKAGAVVSLVSDDAAAKMYELSEDAGRFMLQLAQAKMVVSGQSAQHPLQMGRLAGDAAAIGAEGERTTGTADSVDTSRKQVTALGAQNAADTAAAVAFEQRAQLDSSEATAAVDETQARHDQLAADLDAWARRHREERREAIAKTRIRLQDERWVPTDETNW
jgi:hypothetical protein